MRVPFRIADKRALAGRELQFFAGRQQNLRGRFAFVGVVFGRDDIGQRAHVQAAAFNQRVQDVVAGGCGNGRFEAALFQCRKQFACALEHRQWRALDPEPPSEELVGEDAIASDPLWADGLLLRQILSNLPYQQRQLIELAFYGGHTHSDLAQMLDLPLGTVKTRLRAAIQALRERWMQENTKPVQSEHPVASQGRRDALG